ncbi:succinate dehydrogenase assembly factor 2 [Quercus suber]|uniref:Succinate dehydrogenase assembly factor 2 n=1 Tax=Quercus suber TaxID=58331 RepID=A0AAW0IXJ7_QUESU
MLSLRRSLISVCKILDSNRSSIAATSPRALFKPQYCWVPSNTQSLDIDLSKEESKRQLCKQLDLVLGKWVEEHIHSMDENGIKALVHVLDLVQLENPDLWKWLPAQEQPPEAVEINPVFTALHDKVMNNLNSHSAPETRATPGQPWVRGWDDIKKGQDGPIAGNQ